MTLPPDTFGQMMLQAVRYALGRMTNAPGDTSRAVKLAWPDIPKPWQTLIERDVREEIERAERLNKTVGHQCDHDTWLELLSWMRQATMGASIQDMQPGDYVRLSANRYAQIAEIYGIIDGRLAKPSEGGFGVKTTTGATVTMWQAREYCKASDLPPGAIVD